MATRRKPAIEIAGTTERQVTALLTLLGENRTIVISGARIAREIGVSRSTVFRWVTRLRELGVKVKGRAATGYPRPPSEAGTIRTNMGTARRKAMGVTVKLCRAAARRLGF